MLQIGSLVDGKYKILSEIGHGGMSIVYMAINEKANKTWAIKEVRKNGVLDFEAVRQGLIVETDMLKKLKHPNLPSIVDVIEDEESFVIVMDYIEGNALSVALQEYGPQPQEWVIEWAKQLCDVLEYLHTRTPAIIYRDMKPANVMLKPNGQVMLIDFGTAREFKEKNLADTTCLGTVGYAAPEQFGGMGQTDARTDIYCLGATLYHLVTGCNPSEPPYEIRPIREINPSLSNGLEAIIQKCVQRNPDDRYQSCAELMYDLEHYDTIDKSYRSKQKAKLALFAVTAFASVFCGIASLGAKLTADSMVRDNYAEMMDEAARETDYKKKAELYMQCVEEVPNKGGDKAAYLELIKLYKEDKCFDESEREQLVKLIINHKKELQRNMNGYVEVCFETAKLHWYYYDYGQNSDSQVTRMKSSIEWFRDVTSNAPQEYENMGMAEVYASIGEFYRDIQIKVVEASDKGMYRPFFDKVSALIDNVCGEGREGETVQLELLELGITALQQYTTKFKMDGVSQKEMLGLYEKIEQYTNAIETTTDSTEGQKREIMAQMKETKESILLAYSTEEIETEEEVESAESDVN